MTKKPSAKELRIIDSIVERFKRDRYLVENFRTSMLGYLENEELRPHIHSIKSRIKDPEHLRDKLLRKLSVCKANGDPFDYTPDNLFTRITDLAGIRLLHLHTRQVGHINKCILGIVKEQSLDLVENASARTWDDEYRELFKSFGIDTQPSDTLYTSVHYVVASKSLTTVTCELQVRTLMEEVWGEVDHKINYPHRIESVACRKQIRALARVTSGSTRLVDAIFATVDDIDKVAKLRGGKLGNRVAPDKHRKKSTT